MKTERYIVFDTNVIVSAVLIKQSVARQAFDKGLQEGTLLLSGATLEELYDVLRRKKFNKYILENQRIHFLTILVNEAKLI